ncbi:D-alanyl-D-alanine carboxypeptidase family protein [Methylobacterium sp. OT2]|uniref:D-alanyl-D-alanine carboxypeptidase family protein n=1 Tax=Methylobacterium sp. OT2 TaxID=2813779 RepID=UPI00197B697D|nr:D-alanyl-D-alanine carboxypeptidase family protein [Methylobacterium sp. OT2]MBN4097044.1 D-alanyl-D-alanine carboxypeptidase family protein [Methylobacterium sp. OT2]
MQSQLQQQEYIKAEAEVKIFYGQAGGRAEAEILHVPHDIDKDKFNALNLSDELRAAAIYFLPSKPKDELITSLHNLGTTVRVGPKQHALLSEMWAGGTNISVIAGFRSVYYQALLYASRYLDGSLFDSEGRAYVALPGESEHHQPDRAIDVEDPIAFSLAALRLTHRVFVDQPYLYDPKVAHEPWHFTTIFVDVEKSATRPEQFIKRSVDDLYLYFSEKDCFGEPSEFIFVSGRSTSGAYKCIGSKRATVRESLVDAIEAVGDGWAYYIISMIRGFTPIMDNQIIDHEVGRLAFKIANHDGFEGYLIPSSCTFERLLKPKPVLDTLLSKANILPNSSYYLYKSQVVDFLYVPKVTIQLWSPQFQPDSSLQLLVDTLGREATNWLKSVWEIPFPPYHWSTYFGSLPQVKDLTRYAYVLDALSAATLCRDAEIDGIVQTSLRLFAQITGGQTPHYHNETSDETAVHLLRAADREGIADGFGHLRALVERLSLERALRFLQGDGPDVDIISTGSYADLMLSQGRTDILAALSQSALAGGSERAIKTVRRDLGLSLGCAQLFCSIRDEVAAQRLVEYIVLQPAHPATEARGAYAGYADFRGLLITEALIRISLSFPTVRSSPAVSAAIVVGLRFARTLQLKSNVGVVRQQAKSGRGAITHSLSDHNFYVDYTGHAVQLARLAREWLR